MHRPVTVNVLQFKICDAIFIICCSKVFENKNAMENDKH